MSEPLARSREDLHAARTLLDAGLPSQGVARAYMAGFHAASAALSAVGTMPATRTGVVAAFGRRVVSEGGLDHTIGRILRRLFEDCNDVDYALADAPPDAARLAIEDAKRFVDETERWIARQGVEPRRPG